MERKTIFLLFILAVVTLLSIHAGNKYNVDPSEYETTYVQPVETVAEEQPTSTDEEIDEDTETEEEVLVEGLAITFDSDYVYVEQGSEYDLYEGLTLHDDEDSQEYLWDNIEAQGDPIFDVNTVGVYEITYILTNSNGEEATATRTFEVVPAGTEIPDSEE